MRVSRFVGRWTRYGILVLLTVTAHAFHGGKHEYLDAVFSAAAIWLGVWFGQSGRLTVNPAAQTEDR